MKKLFALAALVLGLASCQKDTAGLDVIVDGEQETTISVSLPEATRANSNSAQSALENGVLSDHDLRFILEIYQGENCYRAESIGKETSAVFPVRLVPGHEYDFVVWADFVVNGVDTYFDTSKGLDEIKMLNEQAMTEARDAYYGVHTLTADKTPASIGTITLKRPFAKVRVVTTDLSECIKKLGLKPATATATYASDVAVYNKFNARTKEVSVDNATKTKPIDYSTSTYDEDNLYVDYILVPQNGASVVKFELNVTDVVTRNFNTDIAVEANKLTTIKGNILTDGSDINVELENDGKFEGEIVAVSNATDLQKAINDADEGNNAIFFGADIEGDVTVVQKAGVKIDIYSNGKKYNGSIKVHSNSEHYADAALTIKNVNFETSTASVNFIEALENGSERYSTNITVEGCSFTATGAAENTAVGVQIKASKNAKVIGCTATGVHSLIQAQSCDETVVVKDCTINGKNGVAFKQVKAATVEGTTITATGYGIRFDGNTDNYGIVVKDNNVTAAQPFIVRRMTGANNTIALEGTNTLTTEAEYQIVITNGEDDAEYVKPTGTYTLTGAEGYTIFPAPFPVATWDEFTAALAAGETEIKLTDNIEYSGNYSLKKDVVIDLNGKSITMPMFYVFSTATIKNGTINGKMYARTGCKATLEGLTFSGTISDDLSTEGHLQVQGSCDVYAKNCTFAATTVNGSQTRSLSIQASSSGIRKFEGCDFKFVSWGNGAGKYKKNVYINTMNGTTTVDFIDCKLNGKAPNILFAGTYSLKNLTMSGCDNTEPTLEISRAKDTVTEVEWAHISSLIANNKFTRVRVFYAGGSSEYISK